MQLLQPPLKETLQCSLQPRCSVGKETNSLVPNTSHVRKSRGLMPITVLCDLHDERLSIVTWVEPKYYYAC